MAQNSFKFSAFRTELSTVVKTYRRCLILISFLALSACTQGQPDFEVISEDSIPRPTFNSATTKSIFIGASNIETAIQGECDPKITNLNVQALNSAQTFSRWTDMCVADSVSVTCAADGKFSFTLKKLEDLGFTLSENAVYNIEVKGVTVAGLSKPSTIRITYSTTMGGARPTRITSGSTLRDTNASGFSADIRVTNTANEISGGQTSAEDFYKKTDGNPNGFSAHIGIKTNY